ncbi:MAG: acetyl-CoA carboxylase biotin carboxyl carrier protein [Acidobacteriaceae bacterium]|nr:acetyl-CoA carboxylase biotin carboxyl carrier protein [Acidobacteriaceae bacterium]
MSIDEIKELIRVVQETGISELEYQRGDNKVRIRNANAPATHDVVFPSMVPVSVTPHQPHVLPHPPATAPPAPQPPAVTPEQEDKNIVVKSPIVGTYYDAPSPGAPEFVKVGDQVHPKQVLCIIESMKLMNEIEAEVSGTIVAKLIENGRPVEYGESLFTIRPL